jgi:hypothetical protein
VSSRSIESMVSGSHGFEVTLEPHTVILFTIALFFPRGVKDGSCFITIVNSIPHVIERGANAF